MAAFIVRGIITVQVTPRSHQPRACFIVKEKQGKRDLGTVSPGNPNCPAILTLKILLWADYEIMTKGDFLDNKYDILPRADFIEIVVG